MSLVQCCQISVLDEALIFVSHNIKFFRSDIYEENSDHTLSNCLKDILLFWSICDDEMLSRYINGHRVCRFKNFCTIQSIWDCYDWWISSRLNVLHFIVRDVIRLPIFLCCSFCSGIPQKIAPLSNKSLNEEFLRHYFRSRRRRSKLLIF